MFCILCKKYNCNEHYEPWKTYAEPYKTGYKLYQYSGGMRTTGKKKLLDKKLFNTKAEAILYAWKLKNNII